MNPKRITNIAVLLLALAPPVSNAGTARYPAPGEIHSCGEGPAASFVTRAPSIAPLGEGWTLTLTFHDAGTGLPLAVRAGVWSAPNQPVAPDDPEQHLFQSVYGYSHFYCDSLVTVTVPDGAVTVRAGHGFEYLSAETTLVVGSDTTVAVGLSRFADMNALGWYAADTHVHVSHPPVIYDVEPEQVMTVMNAEGLNVVNSMEELDYFTGALSPVSTPNHLLYFSKEERNAHVGHFSLVGLKQWIPNQTCEVLWHTCARTMTRAIADMVHAQGPYTLVIATHPFPTYDLFDISPWPGGGVWRGMPIDLLGGYVDAVDILDYTHDEPPSGVADYFHGLNLGFRTPPSAGTDAVLGSGGALPAGGYRLYSDLEGDPLTFDGWVEAVRAGRSFVTNYPLIELFRVKGAGPGDSIVYKGGSLAVHVAVVCARPFARLEVIAGSAIVGQVDLPPGTTSLDTTLSVDPGGAGWVVARVTGPASGWHVIGANGLFAQTAPVYIEHTAHPPPDLITVGGFDPLEMAAYSFLDFTEQVVTLFEYAETTPQSRADFDSLSVYALDYYLAAWPDPPGPFSLKSPLIVSPAYGKPVVRTLTPQFRWYRSIDPDPGDSVTYEFQVDTTSTFPDPVITPGIADTVFTIPPEQALTDMKTYYWRVFAVDEDGHRRVATPAWFAFVVDITAVSAGQTLPQSWAFRSVYPNPFNPSVRVEYAVPDGAGECLIAVYDTRGAQVRTLFRGKRPPGVFDAVWNGRNEAGEAVSSGVYFVRLAPAGERALTRKVVLVK